jgi:DNA-binding NarL/FixJ family response regulator
MLFFLLQLALLALGLAAMYAQNRANRHTRAHLDEVLAQLREQAQKAPEPIPLSGMNLNRRTQAVRLLRRGEDVGHIAAALGVPRGEVELLVRVHQMSVKRTASTPEA